MKHLLVAISLGLLALPAAVSAQHQAGGAPAVGTAVPSSPPPAPAPAPASSSGSTSSSSGSSSSSGGSGSTTSGGSGRQRGGIAASGRAVPRGSTGGRGGGGGAIIIDGSGFYPWGYYAGGFDAIDYYGGYYGAYDPWYGWYPTHAANDDDNDETGSLRLKVKPNDASVYVDGFYAGTVDDFDGPFQKLKIERGPHHIEIREPGYAPLAVDVMIQEDFTITYRGVMQKP